MAIERNHIRGLIDKLESLPPERVAEVEDFIDFLKIAIRTGNLHTLRRRWRSRV